MRSQLVSKLIEQIEACQVEVRDLPFDVLTESDVAEIMSVRGHRFQHIPKRFKTPSVIRSAILCKFDVINAVGHENVTDELACFAIDMWGLPAFQVMNDRNKTEVVALHAIQNHAMAYRHLKKELRTQAMSDLAFDLNNHLIHDIPEAHLTTHMLVTCANITISPMRASWPDRVFTQEAADAIAQFMPEHYDLIPDRLVSPEVLARCACKKNSLIAFSDDALKAVIAIRYSLEHLSKDTLMTTDLLKWGKAQVDRDQSLRDFISGADMMKPKAPDIRLPSGVQHLATPQILKQMQAENDAQMPQKKNRLGLYAILYEMNADKPDLLAAQDWNKDLLPDLVVKLHGTAVALKYFPKARQRGRWLEEDLGL